MPNLDALLEISKIVRLIAGNLFYRRFVSNIAIIVLLTVITGMLVGMLLIGGCYVGYLSLLHHGLDAEAAMLATGSVVATAATLCAALTIRFIRKLRKALIPVPAIPQVMRLASSFVCGFTEAGPV